MKLSRFFFAPLLLVLAAWGGCTTNPYKTAATATPDNRPETIALASFAMFTIAEEAAADVKEMSGTPQNVKDALKAADAAAAPVAEQLRDAALEVKQIRATAIAGGSGAEALPAKLAALNQLLTDSAPRFQAFTDALNKAKGVSP